MRFARKGVSVSVVLDRRRIKTNGLYPVKIEVVFHRKQKYFSTGIDISEEKWTLIQDKHKNCQEFKEIEEQFSRVRNEVADLVGNGIFSFILLDTRIGRESGFNVNKALEDMIGKCRNDGRINSYYRYRSTLLNLERFGGKEILFSSINSSWLEHCEKFWREEGKSSTTISIYMKTLKCVFNQAKAEGYIKDSPFGRTNGYTIPRGAARKLALTKSQIKKVMEFKGNERLEKYRDLWLFSYLCNGINFRDMLFLRYDNIVNGEIHFTRAKTRHSYSQEKLICAVMLPEMRDIIRRWGNPDNGSPETMIFKFASGTENEFETAMLVRKVICKCNAALKEIARRTGIPAFTTYSARHSFATIMQRSGVEISFISECLGHSSLAITETYLAGFGPEDRLDKSSFLIDL